MDTLSDLVKACEGDDPALRAPPRSYSAREFRITVYKTGNFLRHCGVGAAARVVVADDPTPEAVFAFYGAALLGGTVAFGPVTGDIDARALIAPTARLDGVTLPPGGRYVGYGDPPDDPSHAFFERDVWSENPTFPPSTVEPDEAVFVDGSDENDERTEYTHADVLAMARSAAAELPNEATVAVRASLADVRTVAAGLMAPLLVDGSVYFPTEGTASAATDTEVDVDADDLVGDVAVTDGRDAPESRTISVDEVANPRR